jgi:ribose transport system permease protein
MTLPRSRTAERRVARAGFAPARALVAELPMLPVAVLAFAFFALTVDGFLSQINLVTMARQMAPLLIAACGATMVFLLGGIDLSVGAVMSLASVVGALVMRDSGSPLLGLLAGTACGGVVGVLNGIAVGLFRLTPFVHTLAALLVTRAVAFLISKGHSIGMLPPEARLLGRMGIAGVPLIFLAALIVAAVTGVVLARTRFGRTVYLMGANRRAAVFSGLPFVRTEFLVYAAAGLLAALAGMVAVLWLGSGAPVLGDNLLLQVIAAVVIGGTSILGGSGSIGQTVTGVALVTILDKGLNLLGLAFYDQAIALGIVIVIGSGFGAWLGRRRIRRAQERGVGGEGGEPAGAT